MDPFAYETDDGVPVWPRVKKIDGRLYIRHSEHMSPRDAERVVEKIRSEGGYAQMHEVSRPKFGEYDGAWGRPACAAVYCIPPDRTSHDLTVDDDGTVRWAERETKPRKRVDSEAIEYGEPGSGLMGSD